MRAWWSYSEPLESGITFSMCNARFSKLTSGIQNQICLNLRWGFYLEEKYSQEASFQTKKGADIKIRNDLPSVSRPQCLACQDGRACSVSVQALPNNDKNAMKILNTQDIFSTCACSFAAVVEFHRELLALIMVSPKAWQLTGVVTVPQRLEGDQHSTERTLEFNLLKQPLRVRDTFPERDCSRENSCTVTLGNCSGDISRKKALDSPVSL